MRTIARLIAITYFQVHSSELPASAEGFADMVDDYEELMERHCSLAKLLYVKDQVRPGGAVQHMELSPSRNRGSEVVSAEYRPTSKITIPCLCHCIVRLASSTRDGDRQAGIERFISHDVKVAERHHSDVDKQRQNIQRRCCPCQDHKHAPILGLGWGDDGHSSTHCLFVLFR